VDYGRFLAQVIGETPDSQKSFDALAIHPYAPSSAGVVQVLDRARRILDENGLASTPIWVTELGWSSFPPCRSRPTRSGQRAAPLPDCDPASRPLFKGVKGQARLLAETMRAVVAGRDRWRLDHLYVFAWRDLPPSEWSARCAFCLDSGLVSWRALPDGSPVPKPSWRVFEQYAR
jgi:hypothetical protein